MENGPVIDGLPNLKKGGSFHGKLLNNQMVTFIIINHLQFLDTSNIIGSSPPASNLPSNESEEKINQLSQKAGKQPKFQVLLVDVAYTVIATISFFHSQTVNSGYIWLYIYIYELYMVIYMVIPL